MSESTIRSSGSRFLENLAYLVPTYEGYRDPARRRDEDAKLRSRLIDGLLEVRGALVDFLDIHSSRWIPSWVEGIERRILRLETLSDTIRYAPYGFSGFFDAAEVREETIEKILEVDLLIFDDLDELERQIRGASPRILRIREYQEFLDSFDERLGRMERRLITRDKCLGDH
jgi:hypothetical protein